MYATQNMALTSWDQLSDDFDHTKLDSNWTAIDQHDHSVGKGVQINTLGIANNAITSALIAAQAVGSLQLAANAVGTSNIQAGAVGNAQLGVGSVYGGAIPNGAITSGMLDPTLFPLGMVVMWWRPAGSNNTPGGGWEIMDGRPWNTISNSLGLSVGNIPDTRNFFIQGADILGQTGPGIGATGGANTVNLSHAHNLTGHVHTIPSHTHQIPYDGNHMHYWQGGLSVWSRTNALPIGSAVEGFPGDKWLNNTFYTMYINGLLSKQKWADKDYDGDTVLVNEGYDDNDQTLDGNADMDWAGSHNHGGVLTASGTLTTDHGFDSTTSALSTNQSIVPQNLALLLIMKVR